MNNKKIINYVKRRLDFCSVLRKKFVLDPLPKDVKGVYKNEYKNKVVLCMVNNNKCEKFHGVNVAPPIFEIKQKISKKDLENENYDTIVKGFINIEENIFSILLKESFKEYNNELSVNSLNDLKDEIDDNLYLTTIIVPKDKKFEDFLIKYDCYPIHREIVALNPLIGYADMFSVYRCEYIDDIYVLPDPEYLGVIALEKDIDYREVDDCVEFYYRIGVGLFASCYVNKIVKY
jgi:hypothetical protein